jgi:hypothetical protein
MSKEMFAAHPRLRTIAQKMFYLSPDWLCRLIYSYDLARDYRQPYFQSVFRHVADHHVLGDYLEFGSYRGRSLIMA